MEALNHRALPTLVVSSLNDKDGQVLNKVHGPSWTGVETREVVLRQFQSASDIVVIDAEENVDLMSRSPAPKRRRLEDRTSAVDDEGKALEKRCILSTMPRSSETEADATRQTASPKSKKRLFQSTRAKQNMFKLSGAPLPTPPTSPDDKSHHTDETNRIDAKGETSRGFNRIRAEVDTDVSMEDTRSAAELSMQMSHLFKALENHELPTATKTTTSRVKSHVEAAGITRSQELRAKRKRESQNDSKAALEQPSALVSLLKEAERSVSRGITAVRIHNHVNVSNKTKDADLSSSTLFDSAREGPLDIAQGHVSGSDPSKPTATSAMVADKLLEKPFSAPNPFSRDTAERFRTQDRHLNHSIADRTSEKRVNPTNKSSVLLDIYKEQKRREERLKRITQSALSSPWATEPKEKERSPTRSPPKTFRAPDLGNGSRTLIPPAKRQFDRQDLRKLMGTSKAPSESSLPSKEADANCDAAEGTETNLAQVSRSKVSLATLEQFHTGRTAAANGSRQRDSGRSDVQDAYDTLPPQGTSLNLTKVYEKEPEHIQKMIVERETLKERIRDLEVIGQTFAEAARLGAITALLDGDLKQLAELKKYSDAVLLKELSGKPLRKRIGDIRDNFRRRRLRVGTESAAEEADEVLQDIMKPEYDEQLRKDIPATKARLFKVKTEIDERRTKSKGGLQKIACKAGKHKMRPHVSKSETSRLAFEKSQNRRIAALQNQLSRYTGATGTTDTEDSQLEVIDLGGPMDDAQSVTSEEDVGEDFMRPLGLDGKQSITVRKEDLSMEDGNSLGNEGQEVDLQGSRLSSTQQLPPQQYTQAHSQLLLEQMLAKRGEQEHVSRQETQGRNPQLLREIKRREASNAVKMKAQRKLESYQSYINRVSNIANANEDFDMTSDQEFEDSDLDVKGEDEEEADDYEDGERQCWRYIITLLECNGLFPELEGHESVQGRFLKYDRAKKEVERLVAGYRVTYKERHETPSDRYWNTRVEEDNEKYDFVMTHMNDSAVGCHFRIEKQLYSPSKEVYEKARVQEACQPIEAWFVDWKRIISVAVEETETTEASEARAESAFDRDEEGAHEEETEYQQWSDGERKNDGHDNHENVQDLQIEPQSDHHANGGTPAPENVNENTDPTQDQSSAPNGIPSALGDSEQAASSDEDTSRDKQALSSSSTTLNNDNDDENDSLFGSDPDLDTAGPQSKPPISISSNRKSASFSPANEPTQPTSSRASPAPAPSSPSFPSQPLGPTVTEPIITHMTGTDLRIFSSLAHANRHATDVFMKWYKTHPDIANNPNLLKVTENDLEEELAYRGDKELWKREEDFPFVGEDGVERRDKLRVWVRTAKSWGPRN